MNDTLANPKINPIICAGGDIRRSLHPDIFFMYYTPEQRFLKGEMCVLGAPAMALLSPLADICQPGCPSIATTSKLKRLKTRPAWLMARFH